MHLILILHWLPPPEIFQTLSKLKFLEISLSFTHNFLFVRIPVYNVSIKLRVIVTHSHLKDSLHS